MCNSVTVLSKNKGLTIQTAMDQTGKMYAGFKDTYQSSKEKISTFGPETDEAIRSYTYGLEQWVYGNLVWSFDCQRYFGEGHEEVRQTGIVKLEHGLCAAQMLS